MKDTTSYLLFLLAFLAGCTAASLQPSGEELGEFVSRQDFFRRLEPRGNRILHGAGANPQDFAEYWEELERTPPILYATHFDLMGLREDWIFIVRMVVERYPAYLIPQLGLSMTYEGRPYEDRVARGELDGQLEIFCRGLAELGRPAFVRLGYGFNSPWTGYRPEPYGQAWRRVAEAIRSRHALKNVALVWTAAAEAPLAGFIDYYPGDSQVDWWGIDLFDPRSFEAEATARFVEAARERGFPVMVGEAAPRGIGIESDTRSWERWFVPFFRFLRSHANVKAFCYIHWRAGNTRIAADLELLQRYRTELAQDLYQHAAPLAEVRWQLYWEE